jgi:hypothetical protein
MTNHPDCCRGHRCDRCHICLSGTCCQTVSSGFTASGATADLVLLREAIAKDAATYRSVGDLVVDEALPRLVASTTSGAVPVAVYRRSTQPVRPTSKQSPPPQLALPVGSISKDLMTQSNQEKEQSNVTRTNQR